MINISENFNYIIKQYNNIYKNDDKFSISKQYNIEILFECNDKIINKITRYAIDKHIWIEKNIQDQHEFYDNGNKHRKYYSLEIFDLTQKDVAELENFIIKTVKELM